MPSTSPSFISTARRKQLLRSAIETIADVGYQRASMEQIAGRAGVSVGVISYHFGNKDSLVAEVVRTVSAAAAEAIGAGMTGQPSAGGALAALITGNLRYVGEHRDDVLALGEVVSHSGRNGPYTPLGEQAVNDVAGLLRRGQESGEFRPFDAVVLAPAIRGAIDAAVEAYARD